MGTTRLVGLVNQLTEGAVDVGACIRQKQQMPYSASGQSRTTHQIQRGNRGRHWWEPKYLSIYGLCPNWGVIWYDVIRYSGMNEASRITNEIQKLMHRCLSQHGADT